MKLNYYVLFLLIYATTNAQQVTGKIIDTDKNPIAYANIQINNKGTISNEEGDFSIETVNFKTTDSVKISFLGYKTLKLVVKDFVSKNYTLEEEINDLSEVEVSKKTYTLDEILDKIKEHIDSNYVKTNTKQEIFSRSSFNSKFRNFEFEIKKATLLSKKARKEVNKSFKEFIKTNLNKESKNYSENLANFYSYSDKNKLKVVKATRLIDKENDKSADRIQKEIMKIFSKHLEKGATYKVNSGLFPVEDSLKIDDDISTSIYKDSAKLESTKGFIKRTLNNFKISNEKRYDFIHKTNRYSYTLKGFSTLDNEKIYVINFKPKRSSAKFIGTMYVNAYDFAVVKLKYGFAKGKGNSKNFKLLFGVKTAQSKNNVEVTFKKNYNDLYSLKFAKQETADYAFINRSLRFRKNRTDKNDDKRMIKMEFLLEVDNKMKQEFYVIDENEISKKSFDKIKEAKKYKINYISKYSPDTWKGYNVLSPVNEIKNYGK